MLWICIHGCTEVRRVKSSSTQNSMLPSLFLVGVAGSWAPPAFTVDVSKPPHERWAGAVRTVLDHHGNKLATGFEAAFTAHNASLFDNLNASTWARLGTAVQTHYPEQAAELGTIANELTAAGLPTTFEYLAGWAYFHALAHTELSSDRSPRACTGVVAQHPTTGAVVHGANMDQTPPEVRNLTLRVSFVNGSDHLFEGVDWYWFTTGVSRAVRRGLASVQENWRFGSVRAADVLADVDAGVVPQIWVFRRAFERLAAAPAATFDDFAAEMATVRLAAPYYVIAAGAQSGEGVVITRNTTGAVATRRLGAAGGGALVQTNYDARDPKEIFDPRRAAAEQTAAEMDAAEVATPLGVFAILSTFPVLNPKTAYTAVMSAATGELHAYIRVPMCPTSRSVVPVPSGVAPWDGCA